MTYLWILGGCGCLLITMGLFVWKKQALYLLNIENDRTSWNQN
jgi:hypothetical protein